MRNIHIISRLKYILLLVTTLGTCLPFSYGAAPLAGRVRAFLVGQANVSPTLVGPALRDVIEGRANDGAPIQGNSHNVQIVQQKDYIQFHARTHRHFGDNNTLLNIGNHFYDFTWYPSRFNIQGVPENQANATRICNEIILLHN